MLHGLDGDDVRRESLVFMLLVAGCYDHQRDVDAAIDAYDPCSVAGYQVCNACGRDSQWCQTATPRGHCIDGLCLPVGLDGSTTCGPPDYSCPDERLCMYGVWIPPLQHAGLCEPQSLCDELAAAAHPMHCIWDDGTERTTGAPTTGASCPSPVAPGTPFCGSPCGGCAELTSTQVHNPMIHGDENFPVCIGRSDARQFGICGVDLPCQRGTYGPDDVCVQHVFTEQFPYYPELGLDCSCVVFTDPSTADGLSDYGFPTRADACLAYRAMYPGQVECIADRAWSRVPP